MTALHTHLSITHMLADVPRAHVTIVNPTHYAVSLRYEPAGLPPVVVAAGTDALALHIQTLSREHRVPVIEHRLIARSLYHTVPVGQAIPLALDQAVAEILAPRTRSTQRPPDFDPWEGVR